MALKLTRPLFADHAKGSIFPGFALTTKGAAGFLSARPWPPPKGGHPAPPGAALFALRAQVYPAQPLYRLDAITNAVQQASRSAFPAGGARLMLYAGPVRVEFAAQTTPRTLYLAGHPPPVLVDHSPPTV